MSIKPTGALQISSQELVRFALVMLGGVTIVQLIIAFVADNRITVGSTLPLVLVAIDYGYFQYRHRKRLRMRAYSEYFVHLCGYILVNGSYWLHAWVLVLIGNRDLIDNGWYPALFGMSLFWGVGLLIHTFGALVSKGHEDVHI
jgi:hypothetical protein